MDGVDVDTERRLGSRVKRTVFCRFAGTHARVPVCFYVSVLRAPTQVDNTSKLMPRVYSEERETNGRTESSRAYGVLFSSLSTEPRL
jgi:hypothetical protein